jgi:uncharacterized membrane protein
MSDKHIEWLYRELPGLLAKGCIDDATAGRLRAHYGELAPKRPGRMLLLVFGILGALLIGDGIILVLAHNWDDMSRPVRAVLSFLPLLMAQALAVWVAVRRNDSLAWREGSATLVFLMIGASISLVAQTYNISGDFPLFLLTWSLLGLPLVYLLDALMPAILYLWGISAWACHISAQDGSAAGYWLLLALLAPFAIRLIRADRYQPRLTTLLWWVCASVTVAAGVTTERVLPGVWVITYSSLFALLFQCGEFWFGKSDSFMARPLRHFGAGGILVLSFLLTFEWPWHEIGWHHHRWEQVAHQPLGLLPDVLLGVAVPVAAVSLLATTWRRKQILALILGLAPVLAACGYALASSLETFAPAAAIFDVYLLVVGLWLLITGIRIPLQGQMNLGLVIISALIVARFFDTELNFLLRGIIFIALGVAFLVANVILIRRKGASHE